MAIIYNDTVENFKTDVLYNEIVDKLKNTFNKLGISGGSIGEIHSWCNSLRVMKDILDIAKTDDDCKVAIEYNIPQTAKRVDFMILGSDDKDTDNIVIIELKQWAKVEKVNDTYEHSIMSDLRSHEPVAHPCYQAYSYKALLVNYCHTQNIEKNNLIPCAYLHNLDENYRPIIEDKIYAEWLNEAPAFLRSDTIKIANFISKYIKKKSKNGDLLYSIDYGKIKPTKALQDSIDSMLCGNKEFELIDEQVVAYDMIFDAMKRAQSDNKKHILIISGGPGTGKSVLAINLLANCISKLGLNASYITKNSAPRKCYSKLLENGNARNSIDLKLAIMSPFALPNLPANAIDVGIFDEAHRMQHKPFRYHGLDMLEDAIRTSRVSVFFVDEDQRICTKDCYDISKILETAKKFECVIETPKPYELTSQFRCGGSDGYIAFLNNLLNIKETANTYFDFEGLDIEIFDNPNKMRDKLRELNQINNKARMVAGYCYDWNVKNKRGEWDIELEDNFKAKWNLSTDDVWAVNVSSFEQVGCIHTCQGMEFDYVGVFIGKDLLYRNNKVTTNQQAISKDDKTSGIKFCKDFILADKLIKNTYKVLLTRGQKGVFIYCEDKALSEYLKSKINVVRN